MRFLLTGYTGVDTQFVPLFSQQTTKEEALQRALQFHQYLTNNNVNDVYILNVRENSSKNFSGERIAALLSQIRDGTAKNASSHKFEHVFPCEEIKLDQSK